MWLLLYSAYVFFFQLMQLLQVENVVWHPLGAFSLWVLLLSVAPAM